MSKITNKKCPRCGGKCHMMTSSRSAGISYKCDECGERFALKQISLGDF